MRKISATMATQHPDHARTPYWKEKPFISTQEEAEEAFLAFSDLGINEYKWDWEGKLVDESVLEKLFTEHFSFFQKYPLGQERFLTFRLPNPKVQTEFRLGRAFMNLASAASVAKHFSLPTPPLFEVILPMTETPEEIFMIQEAYQEIHGLKHELYRLDGILTNLRVVPLFEQVSTMIHSDEIIRKYFALYKTRFKKLPPYFRPYVARSDPALNSGLVPTVLAIKIALSKYSRLEKEFGIPFYPIIGAAALPFRGGLQPKKVREFAKEYRGIRTTTIQSAFRYDYPKKDVQRAIAFLEETLPKKKAVEISKDEERELLEIISAFEKYYQHTIEGIASFINQVATLLPKRRERVQHIGLFGYSRGVGHVQLPRAISFTGALYSIGIPPEFIGTGRGLRWATQQKKLHLIEKYYVYIKSDLLQAGRYLNKENLKKLSKKSPVWKEIEEDILSIEKFLGENLGPKTASEKKHVMISSTILEWVYKKTLQQNVASLIEEAALLRKSLG